MANSLRTSTVNIRPQSSSAKNNKPPETSTSEYAGTSASGSAGQKMSKVSTKEI